MLSLTHIKLSLQLLGLFFLFNQSSTWMASKYEMLMSAQYKNEEGRNAGWSSVMVVIMLQKLGVLILSWVGLQVLKILIKKKNKVRLQELPTSEHEDSESGKLNGKNKCYNIQQGGVSLEEQIGQRFEIKCYEQIILGVLLFLSIVTFSYLQSSMNIVYVLIQKCISCLILYLVVDCSKVIDLSLNRIFCFVCFCGVMVLSTLVKIVFNEIEGFYSAQLGPLLQQITVQGLFGFFTMTALDIALYQKLWTLVGKNQPSGSQKFTNSTQIISSLYKSLCITYSTTKYCLALLVILSLIKGQLLPSLQLIQRNQSLYYFFIQLALVHFFNQIIIFYIFTTFNIQVFMLLILTNGAFAKATFFFTRTFDIHTVVFILLIFFVASSIKQQISFQTEQRSKHS